MTIRIKIISGVLIVVLLGLGIVFRNKVSQFLALGNNRPPEVGQRKPLEKPTEEEPKNNNEKPAVAVVATGAQEPVYKGRPAEEFRPVPEEVKLFTGDQLAKLKASLEQQATLAKTSPLKFNNWIQIGLYKKTIGDFEGARDAWEYASVLQPKNSLSFANLGELYWRYLHLYPQSEKNFKTSIAHKPEDPFTYISLAELYHYSYKGKEDLADDVLFEGLASNPGDENLTKELAYIYELRGDYQNSLIWWKKLLVLHPDDAPLKDRVAKLEAK